MKTKKTEKANLENKRLLFIEIGLIVALAIVYAALETKSIIENQALVEESDMLIDDDFVIPITYSTPPPPPAAPRPVLSDIIDIVEDEIEVSDDMIVFTDDYEMKVEIKDYIPVEEEEVEEDPIPFAMVEQKPKFNKGDANDFSRWVNQRLKYPEICVETGVQGKVILSFVVGADGSVSNVKVLRSVDRALDQEAIRVVSSSPKWEPGMQRDRAVPVTYTFPVVFQLR